MNAARVRRILTLNLGSATVKAALFAVEKRPRQELAIEVSQTGASGGRIRIADSRGKSLFAEPLKRYDSALALDRVADWLSAHGYFSGLVAVGHRLVHGGPHFRKPRRITAGLLARLERVLPLDPDHLPEAIRGIRLFAWRFPKLPQVACFDTAFHSTLPPVARMYALPRQLFRQGIRRYGFHGLSYEYVLGKLRTLEGKLARGRVIIAHLGSGASLAALRNGKSVDTSMGLTPLEGLVMSKRSGDVDPGALLYLLRQGKISAKQLDNLLNHESGLLGVSGTTGDMQKLLERAPRDARAAEAVELFCYRVKKYIGAYAAVLGGLDILVFTGGIGEHAAAIRRRICEGLEFLGLELDPARNRAHAAVISKKRSRIRVRVIQTNEDLMIVNHVLAILGKRN